MQEILNNTIIQSIIVFLTTYLGVITGLILFLRNLKKSLKEAEKNSASFSVAQEKIEEVLKNYETAMDEVKSLKTALETIKKRQECLVCNDENLVKNGTASRIMAIGKGVEENAENESKETEEQQI